MSKRNNYLDTEVNVPNEKLKVTYFGKFVDSLKDSVEDTWIVNLKKNQKIIISHEDSNNLLHCDFSFLEKFGD